jgi:hypothetical protein
MFHALIAAAKSRHSMGDTMARGNSTSSSSTSKTTGAGTPSSPAAATGSAGGNASDAIEQQVVAFAEQLGRIVGTVQAKAEGWLDTRTLTDEVSRVRDSAASLLQQLEAAAQSATERIASAGRAVRPSAAPSDRGAKVVGRSGGAVDAPGKKHRKPTANTPLRANAADGRLAKMKSANANANRKRGRG